MDQYDLAKQRAAKFQERRERQGTLPDSVSRIRLDDSPIEQVMTMGQKISENTLHLPKVKPPKSPPKRTNEIALTVYVDGQELHMTAFLALGDIIGSQRTRQGLSILIRDALATKFGRVNIA